MTRDLLLPTDNEWGVPCLWLPSRLPSPPLPQSPCIAWGSTRRHANAAMWSFYVDDYRFAALWNDPEAPLRGGCRELVEPNFTIHDDTRGAEALWRIFQKRSLARRWQDAGASIWVDLCVSRRFDELSLLGVPRGWQRYATAGWDSRVSDLDEEWEIAVRHSAGAPFTLLVWGGGKATREWCQHRAGAIHVGRSADKRHRPGEGTRAKARRERAATSASARAGAPTETTSSDRLCDI